MREPKDRVVLAYSGGLDTSVAIKWLQENYDLEVIAVAVDVGQGGDLEAIKEKALKIGAVHSEMVDAKKAFAEKFIAPALKANALYEKKYPLATSLSRPLIAKILIEAAEGTGAVYAAHGCTGKGNDQVRFEVTMRALNPDITIIAPAREWDFTRESAIEYAQKHNIPISITKKSPYSIDENVWGKSIECGILEDPWIEPPADAFTLTVDPMQAPDEPTYVEIEFEQGVPIAVDGQKMNLLSLIEKVNQIAGSNGFGRIDKVENRLVGIKSREIYEAPAALTLIMAHRELEDMTLTRDLMHFKYAVEEKYADLIYDGLWFGPLRESLDAFINETQKVVNGTIRLKLYKGSCQVVGRKSPNSLYDRSLATYEADDTFSHKAAEGFNKIFGLSLETWGRKYRK
ncbi:MAG: argininosuccinate synthase [Candidatus Aquicultor secundus]|nr:argininosuccinate synthase [Solirubrobacter sp.]OIO85447.1 MAG: argininosuccinate synthase [Candidatus Aquicultor secundus]